jgi:hypothetical protein
MVSKYGHHFERYAIKEWLDAGNNFCPVTGNPLSLSDLVLNRTLQADIVSWKMQHSVEDVMAPPPPPPSPVVTPNVGVTSLRFYRPRSSSSSSRSGRGGRKVVLSKEMPRIESLENLKMKRTESQEHIVAAFAA